MFAITGASGNTGSVVARELLARGERVRVIGRETGRLAPLVREGAEAFVAELTNTAKLTQAFEGVEGVYAMLPPNPSAPDVLAYQTAVSDSLMTAIGKASVRRAVVLSSIGADKAEKTGPVLGLHYLEERLNGIAGLNAVYLRAGYFMENLLPQVQVIPSFGQMAGPLRPDVLLPLIATHDIGTTAAAILRNRDLAGKQTRELLGQRDLDYRQAASVIGRAIGKPDLSYVQLAPEQLKPMLMQMGMSESMADLLLEMSEALNSGHMKALESRSPQNTTSTTIETFAAEQFAPLYRGNRAGA